MASQKNIYNPTTKQFGYQVEGAAIPAGWMSVNSPQASPAPTPAPAAPVNPKDAPGYDPAKDPTSSVNNPGGVRRYTGTTVLGESTLDKESAAYYGGLDRSQPNEAQMRNDALSAVQAQIDNIKTTYAGMLASEKTAGVDRLGRTRAVSSRSGLLGSDFGNADMEKTVGLNKEKEAAVMAEQAMKVDEILAGVNKDVQERVRLQKETANKNTESYLGYLKNLGDKAKDQIKQLASSGFSLDQLTDAEYNHLLETTGFTPEQIKAEFALNVPKQNVLHSEVQGNKYIQVVQDPITKKSSVNTIDLGFDVPVGYKTEKMENGQLVFYPEKLDPNKPFKDQILTYGSPTSPTKKPQVSGNLTYTQDDLSQGAQDLNSRKGSDGYTDPNYYATMAEWWVKNGGLIQDFVKNYPPSAYINPANTSLPQYLRSKNLFSSEDGGGA